VAGRDGRVGDGADHRQAIGRQRAEADAAAEIGRLDALA
jgi:hypothetical protein